MTEQKSAQEERGRKGKVIPFKKHAEKEKPEPEKAKHRAHLGPKQKKKGFGKRSEEELVKANINNKVKAGASVKV
ncbi:MAG: hypothetical protein D6769_01670 [Methanobacteriota archaeon]|nr:MAG: hypothetical protein D6769_01670 [Euryarchaeota archaeon]